MKRQDVEAKMSKMSSRAAVVMSGLLLTQGVAQAQFWDDGVAAIDFDQPANAVSSLATDIQVGDRFLLVESAAALAGTLGALAAGDLLLVHQAYASESTAAGRFVFVVVGSVLNNTIHLDATVHPGGFTQAFEVAAATQVLRVPTYSEATVPFGEVLSPSAFDGRSGGVLAMAVETKLNIVGRIDASATGFRGGQSGPCSSPVAESTAGPTGDSSDVCLAGQRGESSFGDWDALAAAGGAFGRTSLNGSAGGGSAVASGGGGGSNAAVESGVYTAVGVPGANPGFDIDAEVSAIADFANAIGGGRGGYSLSRASNNAQTVAPGDAAWTGNLRRLLGGLGGEPTVVSTPDVALLGGGGGAGHAYTLPSSGGRGGGVVILWAGEIVCEPGGDSCESSQIVTDGAKGLSIFPNAGVTEVAGAGGGGAGGSVWLVSPAITNLGVSARGGAGGDVQLGISGAEGAGPGGGGSGGVVYLASTASGGPVATVDASGGGAGQILASPVFSGGATPFAENGATSGADGLAATTATPCVDLSVCAGRINQPAGIPLLLRSPGSGADLSVAAFDGRFTGMTRPGATVTLSVDGEERVTGVAGASGLWVLQLPELLEEGSYTILVSSADAIDLLSEPANLQFTLTVSAGLFVSIEAPMADSTVSESSFTVSGRATPASKLSIRVGDELVGTSVTDAQGSWQFDLRTAAADGDLSLRVVARDDSGQSVETTVNFTLNQSLESADSDGDGLANSEERPGGVARDTDADGRPDHLDDDDDGDGVSTSREVADAQIFGDDVDGDGVPSWLDADADNDGVPDGDEVLDGDSSSPPLYLVANAVPNGGGVAGGGGSCGLSQTATPLHVWVWLLLIGGLLWRRRLSHAAS